jgi:hypothetical protein
MRRFVLPAADLPPELVDLLFIAWVQYLSEQRLSLDQAGSGSNANRDSTYSFRASTGNSNFTLKRSLSGQWELMSAEGIDESGIEAIVNDAKDKLAAKDFGNEVVYRADLKSPAFAINHASMMNFARLLGDPVYITGRRRLGGRILLEFIPDPLPEQPMPLMFAGSTNIKVTIFTPGPTASDLTRRTAAALLETVAAICAFALGRVVELPLMIIPIKDDEAAAAQVLRRDAAIPTLARESISLDIFEEFAALGDLDCVLRARGALLSYHAALQQANPDVATMLLVSSMEALIVPRPEWRKDKATKRFIEMICELCPEAIDKLVDHINVEEAFSYTRRGGPRPRRRQLLNRIYELRSAPTHEGIGLAGGGMMIPMAMTSGSLRVALLSDLARAVLLGFLQAPRSSLIGHPMFEQAEGSEAG